MFDVEKITDKLGEPVDEKVKPLVQNLNDYGIETTGSCQGHKDHGEPFPWIDIWEDSEEDFAKLIDDYNNQAPDNQKIEYKISKMFNNQVNKIEVRFEFHGDLYQTQQKLGTFSEFIAQQKNKNSQNS